MNSYIDLDIMIIFYELHLKDMVHVYLLILYSIIYPIKSTKSVLFYKILDTHEHEYMNLEFK